eukprot:CAMPEP_0182825530 /NCGR_PEP_ID=MMETSP0006_2-20121128/15889_1 /TAXON_ID=97485 /ORGANISM="Prymnesium parvum, Strain Texoma1" /LENGTH=77 /DNA_ID=CAMNT_0024952633 /DNA_START=864 /DNA_END=1097 /DNA_ORIENTATION=-
MHASKLIEPAQVVQRIHHFRLALSGWPEVRAMLVEVCESYELGRATNRGGPGAEMACGWGRQASVRSPLADRPQALH